jgi:tetratricopeptide (TPR) repeat protein
VIPAWLPLRPDLPGRAPEIAEGRARLEREGSLTISGAPGIGKTSLAGAIVAIQGRTLVAVSLLGCEDAADAVRALGEAVGIRPVGDEGALYDAMRAFGPVDLVVDDIGNEAVLEPLQRAAATAADARLVLVSEAPLPGALVLGGLPDALLAPFAPDADPADFGGNPLLARLSGALSAPVAEALARLGAIADLLAAFPVGFVGGSGGLGGSLPAVATVPDADRVVLRRGIAAHLTPLADANAAAMALPAVENLLALARGAHLPMLPDPRDLLLLRRLAHLVPSRADACRCLAAAARLAAAAGQVQVARALVADPLREGGAPADVATLLWADGDALLAAGEVEDALGRYADASALFRRARDPQRAATLHRRVADRLAARGQLPQAESHYRQARQLYRMEDDAIGLAATLRGAADLAVGAGEWVTAGTLHEQVAATVDRAGGAALERANLRLGEATLAIARGEYSRAERLLHALGVLANDQPLLRANVARRRADLLLRRGDHEGAAAAARQAGTLYATLGEAPANAACARLLGDIAAAAGRLEEARGTYRQALRLQVRIQDLRGLLRTLEHAAVVEEALGRLDEARKLREQRAAVMAVA